MKRFLICILVATGACGVEPGEEPSLEDIARSEQGIGYSFTCASVCTSKDMIIGCDERELGATTKALALQAPYRSVGEFTTGCTGTLIDDRHVLTAGHCFSASTTSSQFILARHRGAGGECRPFGKAGVKRVYRPAGFSDNSSSESIKALDIAIVELNNPIVGTTPMPFRHFSWNFLSKSNARTIGYPYDKDNGSVWRHNVGTFSYNIDQWINGGEKGILHSNTDGVGGQSGSPTYVFHNGVRKVVGVLIGSPIASCQAGNIWTSRITPQIQKHIENVLDPQTIDFWWNWRDLRQSRDEQPNC